MCVRFLEAHPGPGSDPDLHRISATSVRGCRAVAATVIPGPPGLNGRPLRAAVDSFRKLSHRKKEDLNAHVALGTFYSEERAESATAMTEAVKVNGDCGLTAAGATSATLAHMTLARQRKDAFVRDACSRATSCTPAGWRTQAAARTRTAT